MPPAADLIDLDPADLAALIQWYEAMGVDVALGEEAVDRFAAPVRAPMAAAAAGQGRARAEPPAPAGPARSPAPPPTALPAAAPSDDPVMAARAAAAAATSLDELRALLERFEGCGLSKTAKNLVFADGNPAAKLMLVGEAPGRDEDIAGRPFVGRSGQLLDKMLAAIGFDRKSAYIANVVYWRPPGNREPSDLEVSICRPFILRQIELVGPAVLVFLGNQPSKALFGREAAVGIRKFRGRWKSFETGGLTVPTLPTFHPAYLLRQPAEKRLAWQDFLEIRRRLASG
ncbi:uracil-DNA glycosylase [Methylobrevis albus]|uniref:Type-4 uracil-DNA glycosylase n=1 Tax=Methylobrevis albus TaxID=2793297 RepID=A0A931I0X8_9HYPH|nr:uracil-DNA glycosylase [Methylobrevis albus]MBH0238155.1 uracil-DNA glycosylase [Methylobrevis albus]